MAKKEAADIYSLCGGDVLKAIEILEKQLNVLQSRAQVLMSLAGVVFTITGFSGRQIAATNLFSQICVIVGLALVLTSIIWFWCKVSVIKWLTNDLNKEPVELLGQIIKRRNKKTTAYVTGGLILCAGFVIYCAAFAVMLLFNHS
jgi:hypothetical protein